MSDAEYWDFKRVVLALMVMGGVATFTFISGYQIGEWSDNYATYPDTLRFTMSVEEASNSIDDVYAEALDEYDEYGGVVTAQFMGRYMFYRRQYGDSIPHLRYYVTMAKSEYWRRSAKEHK